MGCYDNLKEWLLAELPLDENNVFKPHPRAMVRKLWIKIKNNTSP